MGMNPMMMKAVGQMAMKRKKKIAEGGIVGEMEDMGEGAHNSGEDGMPGDAVYPEGDDKEGLSESVIAEQSLAKGLQEKRMKSNENYNEYESFPGKQGRKEMNQGGVVQSEKGQPLGNKPELDWIDDGTEQPMSSMPMKPASLGHTVESSVPMGPGLSEEAKRAIEEKKMKRRYAMRG